MEITIKAEPKKIADLVSALQGQQEYSVKAVLDSQEILKAIRDIRVMPTR